MKSLEISYAYPYSLTMDGPKGKEQIAIRSNYPDTPTAEMLFRNLGLMHMVAPHMPNRIETDFPVEPAFAELIRRMYAWENCPQPRFTQTGFLKRSPVYRTSGKKAVVADSGGKDSLYNIAWCQDRHGRDNVCAVHTSNMNRLSGSEERKAVVVQQEKLNLPHIEIVDLTNSSQNRGYAIMRSRNIFIVGLCIPFALGFGASRVVIEGFGGCAAVGESFTGTEKNMLYFNTLLSELGIPCSAAWRNKEEMDILKYLIREKPDWLALANSCFSAKYFKGNTRKGWLGDPRTGRKGRTPTFPLFDTQCGSCLKCRVTNIARIRYDALLPQVASYEDIRAYIALTDRWLKDNYAKVENLLTDSFLSCLKFAARTYKIKLVSI